MSNPSGLSDEDELALLNLLKSQPDFDCLPIPAYWFAKYGLPPREALGPREYIASNYAMKKANEPKDLPPIIIDEPQQNGKRFPVFPPEYIPVEVVTRPFNWEKDRPFPAVICPPEVNTPEHRNPETRCETSQSSPSQERAVLLAESGTDLQARSQNQA